MPLNSASTGEVKSLRSGRVQLKESYVLTVKPICSVAICGLALGLHARQSRGKPLQAAVIEPTVSKVSYCACDVSQVLTTFRGRIGFDVDREAARCMSSMQINSLNCLQKTSRQRRSLRFGGLSLPTSSVKLACEVYGRGRSTQARTTVFWGRRAKSY